jgi:protein involved in sex pheromone biosynthesis
MKTIAIAVLAAGLSLAACSGGADDSANNVDANATLGTENLDAGLEADLNATDANASADLNAVDANTRTASDTNTADAPTNTPL